MLESLRLLVPVLIILGQLTIVTAAAIPLIVKLGVALKALSAFLLANPFSAAAIGLLALAAAMGSARRESEKLADHQIGLRKALRDADEAVDERLIKLRALVQETKKQITNDEDYSKNINILKGISEKYFGHLEEGKTTIIELEKATRSYANSIIILAKVKAAEEEMIDLSKEQLKLEREAAPIRKKRNQQFEDIMNMTNRFTRIRKGMEMVVGTSIVPLGNKDLEKLIKIDEKIKHTKGNIKTLADFIKRLKKQILIYLV